MRRFLKYLDGNQMLSELENGNIHFGEKIFFIGVLFFPLAPEWFPMDYQVSFSWIYLPFLTSLGIMALFLKERENIIEKYVCLFIVSVIKILLIFLPVFVLAEVVLSSNFDELFDLFMSLFMILYPPFVLIRKSRQKTFGSAGSAQE